MQRAEGGIDATHDAYDAVGHVESYRGYGRTQPRAGALAALGGGGGVDSLLVNVCSCTT